MKRGDRRTPRCRRLHRERNCLRQQAGGQDDQHGADCGRCDPPSEVVSQSEIDTKALEKNRAEERADHARQCIAYEAAAADEPTREPPRDEPNPDLRGKSLLSIFATASQSTITRTGKRGREFLAGLLRRERRLIRLSVSVFAIVPHMVARATQPSKCCLRESAATGAASIAPCTS